MQDTTKEESEANSGASADEFISWTKKLEFSLIEDIAEELSNIIPYVFNDSDKASVSGSLNAFLEAFITQVTGTAVISKLRLRLLCSSIFCHSDLYMLCLRRIIKKIPALSEARQYWNVFHYLKFSPVPKKKMQSAFFSKKVGFAKPGRHNTKLQRCYQNAWLELVKHELPPQLLKELVPYLCQSALSGMREGYMFGSFLFRIFKLGDIFAVLSLEGIFKLIIEHNFEYPDFYPCVYKLTVPSLCYLSGRKKFFELLDTFLASTHLPTYIVAAFVKRLCRLTLTAPLVCQEPLLSLIRNLTTRHEGVRLLLHRENAKTVGEDPYDEREDDMQKCGATESSLWEIKTIQKHWCVDVAKRANFVDKGVQRVETFVRWKTNDEYFAALMSKKFASDFAKYAKELRFQRNQSRSSDEGEEDNEGEVAEREEPSMKKKRRAPEGEAKHKEFAVPTNFMEPSTDFFPDKFQFSIQDFWKF